MAALAIKASGMVTPVGFSSPTSCAAMRARVRNVTESHLWDTTSGTSPNVGKVPLPQWSISLPKLADLVAPAILECLTAARPVPPREIPVLLGVCSPERPFRFPGLDGEILDEVAQRLSVRLHPTSKVVPRDHVSVAVALREAETLLKNRQAPCCIVAAVDSLIQQELLDYNIGQRRILTEKNSNGFSPGEAGSAVLVTPPGDDSGDVLEILGIGTAREKATIGSDEPLRAEGLSEAIRGALCEAGLRFHDLRYRVTDLNGEHYKFKEMLLAELHLERELRSRRKISWSISVPSPIMILWFPQTPLQQSGKNMKHSVPSWTNECVAVGQPVKPRALVGVVSRRWPGPPDFPERRSDPVLRNWSHPPRGHVLNPVASGELVVGEADVHG